jgi:hypothetical protein
MAANGLGAPVVVVGGTVNPSDILISGGGITGTNPRIRVDVGEPSFFDGRQFRTFKELNIALAATYVIKAVTTKNIILYGLELFLTSGEIKLSTVTGGTEGGTFSETLPLFPRNTMSERPTPIYTSTTVLTAGGTHTGGTILDLLWEKTADNSNFAASVGAVPGDERGVGAGTYYFRLNAIVAATGVFKARFEERLS